MSLRYRVILSAPYTIYYSMNAAADVNEMGYRSSSCDIGKYMMANPHSLVGGDDMLHYIGT